MIQRFSGNGRFYFRYNFETRFKFIRFLLIQVTKDSTYLPHDLFFFKDNECENNLFLFSFLFPATIG